MKQSGEAFWWSLFSAGGVLSALFMPALAVITGLVLPAPVRIVLFGVFFLSFFHAAHRIRHILMDVGWRTATVPLSILCYGGAIVGTGAAAYVLVNL
jgi:fumarate reductase subunit D